MFSLQTACIHIVPFLVRFIIIVSYEYHKTKWTFGKKTHLFWSLHSRTTISMIVWVGACSSCLSVMWNLLTCVPAVHSQQHLAPHLYKTLLDSEVGSKASAENKGSTFSPSLKQMCSIWADWMLLPAPLPQHAIEVAEKWKSSRGAPPAIDFP